MFSVKSSGSFRNTERMLNRLKKGSYSDVLDQCGREGVRALSRATPIDSGETASSWGYQIHKTSTGEELVWTNSNVNEGVNIAIIIQYGHGTRNGTYVQGVDYINPAMRPVFDDIADKIWKAVTR